MQSYYSPFPMFGHRQELIFVTSFFHFQFCVFSFLPESQQVRVLYFSNEQTFIPEGLSPQQSGYLLFPVVSIHLHNWTRKYWEAVHRSWNGAHDQSFLQLTQGLKTLFFIHIFILVGDLFSPTAVDSQGEIRSLSLIPWNNSALVFHK